MLDFRPFRLYGRACVDVTATSATAAERVVDLSDRAGCSGCVVGDELGRERAVDVVHDLAVCALSAFCLELNLLGELEVGSRKSIIECLIAYCLRSASSCTL